MDTKRILEMTDHTVLSQCATEDDIRKIIDEAVTYSTASVCIPPSYVSFAKSYAKGRVAICTVIGFPNGYSTTPTKVFEAAEAVRFGADEIDMVVNLGLVRMGRYDEILSEINEIKSAIGDKILKVIIETCLLNEDEKIRVSRVVSESKADFIKTSTGFSTGGATREDVALLKAHCKGKLVKAAGGIKTLSDAEDFIALGADRLGSSRIVNLVKQSKGE
jgi:deoxyribose-phosphate aldolase